MEYALITGASTGIGLATARCLLQQGYFVFGSVRKPEDAERLKEKLGPQFHPLVFDVRDEDAILKTVAEVEQVTGAQGLAALVNNAGVAVSGPLLLLETEELSYQLDVNLLGVFRVTKAFLPLLGARLPARAQPGKIINISSVSGVFAAPFVGPYCVSKFALEALTDSWRRELLIYGIDVISIRPGPIQTQIWRKAIEDKKEFPDSDYAPILKSAEKLIRRSEAASIPAEKVGKLIYRIIRERRPKTKYLISKRTLRYRLLFYLIPDRWVDYFIGRSFRARLSKEA